MNDDPLLQPFRLKHLTLKNRLMMTAHEPAYPEDGMPKALYREYHVERARAGIGLTMTAGSAAVAKDSPYKSIDDIVQAVNGVGAAPGDLVAILEALKEAGALRAELIVI